MWLCLFGSVAQAQAPTYTTFEGFTPNVSVDGQGGWSATNPLWDEEVVDDGTGNMAWRVSNAVTSGSFGDQPFAAATDLYAGETGSQHVFDGAGAVTKHFYASFDFWSVTGAPQPGLDVTISPDDGAGARQSFLSIEDNGAGIDIDFFDSSNNHPVTNPNGGFDLTVVSTGLSYADKHHVAIDITFVDGNVIDGLGNVFGNDIVRIFVDGVLVHTGTTWESYWWTTTEGQTPPSTRAVDTLLFRLSTPGASPGVLGNGFFFDNVYLSTDFDQDVTPDVIFGSGNTNGSFTVDRQDGVELGLRAKLRFPPTNAFMSNGDGTYTFNTGSGTSTAPNPEWAFEWSVNTDFQGTTGLFIDDLTYELGIDFDPGAGTDYLVFDPISSGSVIPFGIPSAPVPFWDHAIGDNSTPNGGGTSAGDEPTYLALVAANNVVQNSWRTTFFDEPPFVFDPDVPGRYDIYLAASDGGTEVARTAIAVLVTDGASLTLEADPCQTDQDPGLAGLQVGYELWLRNPDDVEVTGYQAFLAFDDSAMSYEGASSSYTVSPFASHIQAIAGAEVFPGQLRLDGNTFSTMGHSGDALLATLVFTVGECDPVGVDFDLTQAFPSELSFFGSPIVTALLDSPTIIADDTPPVLSACPADITQSADAGSCTGAVVTWTDPTAIDNCDPSPTVVCSPASGSTFGIGTTVVTCTATDACGNVSTCTFDVTVTATNLVDVVVELTGSVPTSRCIHFVTDSCTSTADVTLNFVGTAPAVATATIEVPCGVWTTLCAKDEQHTKWGETTLALVGTKYVTTAPIVLDGGDTDNDGDVDINDVTLFLAQFGDNVVLSGGCPWDGVTRDADFSNNLAVASEDYNFLVANWLTTSACSCSLPLSQDPQRLQSVRVHDAISEAADLNRDGVVDVLDVERFEAAHGLSGGLSERMRATQR